SFPSAISAWLWANSGSGGTTLPTTNSLALAMPTHPAKTPPSWTGSRDSEPSPNWYHLLPRRMRGWVGEHTTTPGTRPQRQVGVKSIKRLLQLGFDVLALQCQLMQHLATGIAIPDDPVLFPRHPRTLYDQA